MRKKLIIILVIIVVLVIFFFPKSECGYKSNLAPFTECKCDCLGFIEYDPLQNKEGVILGGSIQYKCFGIKIGKTVCDPYEKEYIISRFKEHPQNIHLERSGYEARFDEPVIIFYGVKNNEEIDNEFKVTLSCLYSSNNTECGDLQYHDTLKIQPGEIIVSSFELTIGREDLEPDTYIWEISVLKSDNSDYISMSIFIEISD